MVDINYKRLRTLHELDQALAALVESGAVRPLEIEGVQAYQLTTKGAMRLSISILLCLITQADIEQRELTSEEQQEASECIQSIEQNLKQQQKEQENDS